MNKRVFLGGTCGLSTWREVLIPMLNIGYFNPVVTNWNEEAYQRELRERETCDYCLYVLTPAMEGFYSIAEVIDDSNKRPKKTVFCVLQSENGLEFNPKQMKSWNAVLKMVKNNGGQIASSLEEVASILNS